MYKNELKEVARKISGNIDELDLLNRILRNNSGVLEQHDYVFDYIKSVLEKQREIVNNL